MKLDADAIRALTPIVLTSTGGLIALVLIGASIFSPDATDKLSEGKWASAMGLAGTAIGGAAGLAQSIKHESESKIRKDEQSGTTQMESTSK